MGTEQNEVLSPPCHSSHAAHWRHVARVLGGLLYFATHIAYGAADPWGRLVEEPLGNFNSVESAFEKLAEVASGESSSKQIHFNFAFTDDAAVQRWNNPIAFPDVMSTCPLTVSNAATMLAEMAGFVMVVSGDTGIILQRQADMKSIAFTYVCKDAHTGERIEDVQFMPATGLLPLTGTIREASFCVYPYIGRDRNDAIEVVASSSSIPVRVTADGYQAATTHVRSSSGHPSSYPHLEIWLEPELAR